MKWIISNKQAPWSLCFNFINEWMYLHLNHHLYLQAIIYEKSIKIITHAKKYYLIKIGYIYVMHHSDHYRTFLKFCCPTFGIVDLLNFNEEEIIKRNVQQFSKSVIQDHVSIIWLCTCVCPIWSLDNPRHYGYNSSGRFWKCLHLASLWIFF